MPSELELVRVTVELFISDGFPDGVEKCNVYQHSTWKVVLKFLFFAKRRSTVFVGVLFLIGVVIFVSMFWRSVQAVAVLGIDSIRWNFPYVIDNLRLLYLHRGDDAFKTAIFDLEKKLSVADGDPKYNDKKLLARLYFYSNQVEKAEAFYRELLVDHPSDTELLKGLGVLLMRRGEIENCADVGGLCQYPLVSIHFEPRFAQGALRLFSKAHELEPSWSSKWLVHLSKMATTHHAEPYVISSKVPAGLLIPDLHEGASLAGVDKLDLGRGGLIADMDGDGQLDIVTASTGYSLGYFKNVGKRRFVDRTADSGLSIFKNGFIIAAGDIDNDGDLDLYVSRNAFYGQMPNIMLRNDGKGNFTNITDLSGTGNAGAGFVATFADYDTDGDLDLFVANMSTPLPFGGGAVANLYGRFSNVLYRNNGDSTFEDVTKKAGLFNVDSHLGAAWGDIDEDGDLDLYVTTYFGYNHLYINQGDGTFVDRARERGVRAPWSSFSGWFFDYDNDSHLDLLVPSNAPTESVAKYLVTNQKPALSQTMRLFKGDGHGFFVDMTEAAGLRVIASAMGANWGDINNDGYPDFYLGTGGPPLEQLEPNLLFLNTGDGAFWNATRMTHSGFLQKGHGVSFADLDGDGWQDLHHTLGGAWMVDSWQNALFWNDTPMEQGIGHFLKVVLRGKKSNSHGVGARITVSIGPHQIVREIGTGGGFGKNPLLAQFGLNDSELIDELHIVWPGGVTQQKFENVPVNKTLLIEEDNACLILLPSTVSSPSYRDSRSELLQSKRGAILCET